MITQPIRRFQHFGDRVGPIPTINHVSSRTLQRGLGTAARDSRLSAVEVVAVVHRGHVWTGLGGLIDSNERARATESDGEWSERSRIATREGLDAIREAHAAKWGGAKAATTTDNAPPARTEQGRQERRLQGINEDNRVYWAIRAAV